jgi:NADP-dependent 3-hydroxy acid dehydrogenase YdfG
MNSLKASNLPDGVEMVQMDVCDSNSVKSAVQEVAKKSGGIDILVNNAGQGCVGALAEIELDRVRNTFETNVFGLLQVSQVVSKSMIERRKGLSESLPRSISPTFDSSTSFSHQYKLYSQLRADTMGRK